jgi:hypothetical protein
MGGGNLKKRKKKKGERKRKKRGKEKGGKEKGEKEGRKLEQEISAKLTWPSILQGYHLSKLETCSRLTSKHDQQLPKCDLL